MNQSKTKNSASSTKKILMSISLIIMAIISIKCTKQPVSHIRTINILDLEKREANISELAEEIEYIPLSNDSMLSTIMNVFYYNGNYFINDNKSRFLRFDENGKLLNQIGHRGRGPDEYTSINDFMIYPESREIYVTGGKKNQIMVFSFDGNYIRSFEIPRQTSALIGESQKNILAFYPSSNEHINYNMELLDINGKTITSYPNKYEFEHNGKLILNFTGECLMYEFNNRLHFKEIFSDTIFYLEGQEMIPELILHTGNKRFTPEVHNEVINELSADPRSRSKKMANHLIPYNLFETNRYLFYNYSYENLSRVLIFDKSINKQFETNNLNIINDFDGGMPIQLKTIKDENTILSWMNAFELKQYISSDLFKNSTPKYPERKKQLEQLANSLDENDNPVLMLLKLKE